MEIVQPIREIVHGSAKVSVRSLNLRWDEVDCASDSSIKPEVVQTCVASSLKAGRFRMKLPDSIQFQQKQPCCEKVEEGREKKSTCLHLFLF